jgi:hypothetical protein
MWPEANFDQRQLHDHWPAVQEVSVFNVVLVIKQIAPLCLCASDLKKMKLLYCDSSKIQNPNRRTNVRQNWGNY